VTPSRLFISVLLLMVVGISAHAKTVYVDDTFYAPIRSGEGTQFRILHQGLRSGTPIELLEQKESGYSRIRTRDGIEGYILTRYLSNTPIARDRLEAANKDLERARSELAEVRQQLQTVTQERSNLASSEQNLEQRSSQLAAELARVKEVSANALSLERRNDELQEENQKLRNDLEVLTAEKERLEAKSESDFMLLGAGLVLGGVLLALVIPMLKPSRKTDNWA